MTTEDEKKGFRVSDIFYYILKGKRIVILLMIVGLIVGIVYSGMNYIRGEMSKEYRVTSSIAIIAQTKSGTFASKSVNPDQDDVKLAQEITDSAIYVMRSERTILAAIEDSNLIGISVEDVQRNLSLSQYNETQIIEMTLLWRSDSEGIRLMESLNKVAPSILLETLKIGNVSVVNSPKATYIIGGSISASTWVLAAALGAALGVLICIMKMLIAPTLTNKKDLKEMFGLEVLGNIGHQKDYDKMLPFFAKGSDTETEVAYVSYILSNRLDRAKCRKVYITSSDHAEGKSSMSANIASEFAAQGKRTLLIDCDFMNPALSAMIADDIPYESTLNALYRGDADITDSYVHIDGCLDLLPIVLDDEPLIFDDPMLETIDSACEGYDYVFIDCAPIGSDTAVIKLNKVCDTALFIARFDYLEKDTIEKAADIMFESGIIPIGVIQTDTKTFRDLFRGATKFFSNGQKKSKKAKKSKNKVKKEKKSKKRS